MENVFLLTGFFHTFWAATPGDVFNIMLLLYWAYVMVHNNAIKYSINVSVSTLLKWWIIIMIFSIGTAAWVHFEIGFLNFVIQRYLVMSIAFEHLLNSQHIPWRWKIFFLAFSLNFTLPWKMITRSQIFVHIKLAIVKWNRYVFSGIVIKHKPAMQH